MTWKLHMAAAGALLLVVTAVPVTAQTTESVIQIAAKKRLCGDCKPLGKGKWCCKNLVYNCQINPKGLCKCTQPFLPTTCGLTTKP
jgi:hypothetical protein